MMYQRLFAIFWLTLCGGLIWIAWRLKAPFAYDPVGPRTYPLLLLVFMILAAIWLAIKPVTTTPKIQKWTFIRGVLCIVVLLLYALFFESLGFLLSTSLCVFYLGLLFAGKPLACGITAICMSGFLFYLFDRLLDVSLPLGILTKIIGDA